MARWSFTALQQAPRRVETTYTAFFRRGRGFPRFQAACRHHAAAFHVGDGLSFRGTDRGLGIVGVPGAIKAVWHRAFPPGANLGTAVVTRQSGKWYAVFAVEAEFGGERGVGDVGIDLELTAPFATSDGTSSLRLVSSAGPTRRNGGADGRSPAVSVGPAASRAKARARLAAGSARIARQRRDHAHKLSRGLVA